MNYTLWSNLSSPSGGLDPKQLPIFDSLTRASKISKCFLLRIHWISSNRSNLSTFGGLSHEVQTLVPSCSFHPHFCCLIFSWIGVNPDFCMSLNMSASGLSRPQPKNPFWCFPPTFFLDDHPFANIFLVDHVIENDGMFRVAFPKKGLRF